MSVTLAKEQMTDPKEMRVAFCETLTELAEANKDVVLLDADLMGAMGTKPFRERFPDRAIDCGIQEANMVGVAAGLSAVGKIPFVHSFGAFLTRRACDQAYVSAAYAKLNVKLIGSDPGITAALNGGTHMSFEDMGIMRLFPGVTVMEPTDIAMLRDLLRQMAGLYGVQYLRLVRRNAVKIYEEGSRFRIGKSVRLREGTDATVVASGFCVAEALRAADLLRERGVSIRVENMFTWKPIDEEAVLSAAADTGAIVTAENHNIIGGLGAAVMDVLVKNRPTPMETVGVRDEFGEVGPQDYLAERFRIEDRHIVEAVKKALARKAL
jgi:transketolase